MAQALTSYINQQISDRNIKLRFVLKIDSNDRSAYLLNHTIDYSTEFGSASASFTLNNEDGIFNEGGLYQIDVGDIVEFSEYYKGDSTEFKKFYGQVNQRSISKSATDRTITINCLDYISILQNLDIDLVVEGTKVLIENETLTPNYLPSPNDHLAQVFDFANKSLADSPNPIIMIRDKYHDTDDPQYDGFEISYSEGQLKLGSPLNAYDNYDVIARSYYIYTSGVYIEDVLEDIITQPDGYGHYLFGESSAQNVIDNHLTETYNNVENTTTNYLIPNYTNSTITIKTNLTDDFDPEASGADPTVLKVEDTTGFPTSGQGEIAGDVFTWTGKTTTTLTGIPSSGNYALKAHPNGSYVEYENTYSPGQVWYMKYSNLISDLNMNSILTNNSSDYIDCGSGSSLKPTQYVTLEFWMNVKSYPTSSVSQILGFYQYQGFTFWGYHNGSSFSVWVVELPQISTTRRYLDISAATIPLNTWVFITVTYDTVNGQLKFYKNGIQVGTTKSILTGDIVYTNNFQIGHINAYFSDVRVYNRILSSTEISNHAIGIYDSETGLVAHWGFLEGSGTTTADSINTNTGTLTGSPTWSNQTYNFTVPSGEIAYIDKRFGRIILDSAISTSSIVTCNTDYSFKTLQTAAVEINYIAFKPRELASRFDAIKKLLEYAAPNYIVRTRGDDKIWSGLLSQSTVADYTLNLIQSVSYMEDEDLYSRVIFYGKNKNPSNIMFNDGIDFVSTGETYKSLASNSELNYLYEEGNSYVYGSTISNAGYIDLEQVVPIVYINGFPIDNKLHQITAMPVVLEITTRTETTSGCHGVSKEQYVKVHTYYYYNVKLSHSSIEPSQPIHFYNATGIEILTLSAYDTNMDYARGVYYVPNTEQNSTLESISTASYMVMYSSGDLVIDYDNVLFKINKNLVPDHIQTIVRATYEYWMVMTPVRGVASIIDGRWDTQVQTEFFATVPSGYNYAIIDLGQEYAIQALDIVAGFYKPDEIRKFDIDMRLTLQYSLDNVSYYNITDKTHNFQLTGGAAKSFEEDDLGMDFSARYLKIILENVKEIDYGNGVGVVAFSEIAAYSDIIVKGEAKLIPTTYLAAEIDLGSLGSGDYPSIISVDDTSQFTEPESGQTELAYIQNSDGTLDSFTYTGLTATSFTGIEGLSESHDLDAMVVQEEETDSTLYDYNGLLVKLGDRMYKENKVSDETLFTQDQIDYLAKRYLLEYVKDHNKVSLDILYQPFLEVGQTVALTDTYNNIISRNYFIESITDNNGYYTLTLSYYPD